MDPTQNHVNQARDYRLKHTIFEAGLDKDIGLSYRTQPLVDGLTCDPRLATTASACYIVIKDIDVQYPYPTCDTDLGILILAL